MSDSSPRALHLVPRYGWSTSQLAVARSGEGIATFHTASSGGGAAGAVAAEEATRVEALGGERYRVAHGGTRLLVRQQAREDPRPTNTHDSR